MKEQSASHRVEIVQDLHGLHSEIDFGRSVGRILSLTPPRYLAGLGRVVIRDAGGLTRKERLFRRQAKRARRRGEYHAARSGSRAFVVLFIDQIVHRDNWLVRWSFVRELLLAQTLYHEIGHHIHVTTMPGHGDEERIARAWSKRLTRSYVRRRYFYLVPLLLLLAKTRRAVRHFTRKDA